MWCESLLWDSHRGGCADRARGSIADAPLSLKLLHGALRAAALAPSPGISIIGLARSNLRSSQKVPDLVLKAVCSWFPRSEKCSKDAASLCSPALHPRPALVLSCGMAPELGGRDRCPSPGGPWASQSFQPLTATWGLESWSPFHGKCASDNMKSNLIFLPGTYISELWL